MNENNLRGIVYLSEGDFSDVELETLCSEAAAKNASLGVTGYLCYSRGRVLQYIEGEQEVVDDLLNTIEDDTRHHILVHLKSDSRTEHLFPSWNMRYIADAELERFQIEHCIENNLLYIKNDFRFKERYREFTWKHVETMARIQSIRANQER